MSISFPCLDLFFLFFTDCLKQYGDFLCKSFSPQPRRMLLWVGFLLVFVDSWSRVLKESLEVSKCESRTIPKHTTCLTEWRFLHVFFGAELVRDTRVDASELQGWDKGNTNRWKGIKVGYEFCMTISIDRTLGGIFSTYPVSVSWSFHSEKK